MLLIFFGSPFICREKVRQVQTESVKITLQRKPFHHISLRIFCRLQHTPYNCRGAMRVWRIHLNSHYKFQHTKREVGVRKQNPAHQISRTMCRCQHNRDTVRYTPGGCPQYNPQYTFRMPTNRTNRRRCSFLNFCSLGFKLDGE